MNPADKFIKEFNGPSAVVRSCTLCKFALVRRKSAPGTNPLGRGAGFVLGNKQRGEMIQHIKQAHPAEYEAARAKATTAKE
jgi:hypothetical protein